MIKEFFDSSDNYEATQNFYYEDDFEEDDFKREEIEDDEYDQDDNWYEKEIMEGNDSSRYNDEIDNAYAMLRELESELEYIRKHTSKDDILYEFDRVKEIRAEIEKICGEYNLWDYESATYNAYYELKKMAEEKEAETSKGKEEQELYEKLTEGSISIEEIMDSEGCIEQILKNPTILSIYMEQENFGKLINDLIREYFIDVEMLIESVDMENIDSIRNMYLPICKCLTHNMEEIGYTDIEDISGLNFDSIMTKPDEYKMEVIKEILAISPVLIMTIPDEFLFSVPCLEIITPILDKGDFYKGIDYSTPLCMELLQKLLKIGYVPKTDADKEFLEGRFDETILYHFLYDSEGNIKMEGPRFEAFLKVLNARDDLPEHMNEGAVRPNETSFLINTLLEVGYKPESYESVTDIIIGAYEGEKELDVDFEYEHEFIQAMVENKEFNDKIMKILNENPTLKKIIEQYIDQNSFFIKPDKSEIFAKIQEIYVVCDRALKEQELEFLITTDIQIREDVTEAQDILNGYRKIDVGNIESPGKGDDTAHGE